MAEMLIGNIRGPKGDTGTGLTVKDFFGTVEELERVENPSVGDAYGVGSGAPYDIYIYSASHRWVNSGAFQPDVNDQAPTYAEATTLENLTSGEKISIAFGKIKKAIRELISHIGNKSNPHDVTAEQIGAVGVGNNVVVGNDNKNNTTEGGIRIGIMYTDVGVPMVGIGTERGSNDLLLATGCNNISTTKKDEFGEEGYYFPLELPETIQNYPTVLKVSNYDGKAYLLRSSNGKKHYAKNEIIPMSEYELLHSGNVGTYANKTLTATYTGNGAVEQEIVLGYKPSTVHVYTYEGFQSYVDANGVKHHYGGLAKATYPCYTWVNGEAKRIIEITDVGFKVYTYSNNPTSQGGTVIHTNDDGMLFYYSATR